MPFKPGHKKIAGRQKGTKNKIPTPIRERLCMIIEARIDDLEAAIDAIDDPIQKAKVMLEMMQYAVPKLSSVEYKDKDKPKTLQDELDADSGLTTRE